MYVWLLQTAAGSADGDACGPGLRFGGETTHTKEHLEVDCFLIYLVSAGAEIFIFCEKSFYQIGHPAGPVHTF